MPTRVSTSLEIFCQRVLWWVGFRVAQLELAKKTRGNKALDPRFESSPGTNPSLQADGINTARNHDPAIAALRSRAATHHHYRLAASKPRSSPLILNPLPEAVLLPFGYWSMSKSERTASELARSEFDRDLGLPHTEQVRATVHDPAGKLRMLRLADVLEITALGKTTIYELQKRGEFPKSVRLTANSVRSFAGWRQRLSCGWRSTSGGIASSAYYSRPSTQPDSMRASRQPIPMNPATRIDKSVALSRRFPTDHPPIGSRPHASL
jgi:predicted DNA-binding transcriptional regulator AlpA